MPYLVRNFKVPRTVLNPLRENLICEFMVARIIWSTNSKSFKVELGVQYSEAHIFEVKISSYVQLLFISLKTAVQCNTFYFYLHNLSNYLLQLVFAHQRPEQTHFVFLR